jgi:PAS domain S-box-containing protein
MDVTKSKCEMDEFRLLVEGVKDYAIFMLDPEGLVSTWNEGAERIKGYRPAEIIGRHFACFYPEEDRDTGKPAYELNKAAEEGRFEDEGWRLRKDGSRFWASVMITALHDGGGTLRGFAKVTRDVTERKHAEEKQKRHKEELEIMVAERTEELEKNRRELELQHDELLKTYRELEKETIDRIRVMEELREKDRIVMQQSRIAAMGEMLGNIAHQWRQPLNALGLMVQQLGLSYEFGEFSKELLDANISKSMEIILHMSKNIDDLRKLASPDKEKRLFRVDQAVTKTVSLIEDSFKEQRITLEVSNIGEPQITGYPNQFGQVLLNILMNARDALLETGTNDARITVRSWTEDGRAKVTIADNAGGIQEEIMGKIFDPYFTTKELGKGTGIGLFMSKTIIEKDMGGRLTVCNAGGGAEFRIEV